MIIIIIIILIVITLNKIGVDDNTIKHHWSLERGT